MPHSKADAATPAPDAGTPGAEAKNRARPDRRASAAAPAPTNGITITRRGLGISLALAVAVIGGAVMYQADRIAGVETQVRDLRVELHTEFTDLRQEIRADIRDLREEMRTEFGALRDEISALRDQVQEVTTLIRTRAAAPADARSPPRVHPPLTLAQHDIGLAVP